MQSYITSAGSTIKYKIIGKGKPIVFLHGWSVDHKLWFDKIESIQGKWKRKYQRVYFDLPGMGKSIASKSIKNTDDMKREVEEFLCVILNKSQCLLAGESYGGYLARGLLIDHMNSIDGLLLLCPLVIPGYRKGRVAKKCIVEKDQRFMNKLSEKDRNEFDYLSVIQTKRMWTHYKKEIDLSILPENEGFLEKQLIGNFSYDINTIEMQYDKPTLILVGKQDTEVGYKDQYDLYNGLKRSTILILDKAGHNLQIERNSLFQASFLDWIERIETYTKSDQTTASI